MSVESSKEQRSLSGRTCRVLARVGCDVLWAASTGAGVYLAYRTWNITPSYIGLSILAVAIPLGFGWIIHEGINWKTSHSTHLIEESQSTEEEKGRVRLFHRRHHW